MYTESLNLYGKINLNPYSNLNNKLKFFFISFISLKVQPGTGKMPLSPSLDILSGLIRTRFQRNPKRLYSCPPIHQTTVTFETRT